MKVFKINYNNEMIGQLTYIEDFNSLYLKSILTNNSQMTNLGKYEVEINQELLTRFLKSIKKKDIKSFGFKDYDIENIVMGDEIYPQTDNKICRYCNQKLGNHYLKVIEDENIHLECLNNLIRDENENIQKLTSLIKPQKFSNHKITVVDMININYDYGISHYKDFDLRITSNYQRIGGFNEKLKNGRIVSANISYSSNQYEFYKITTLIHEFIHMFNYNEDRADKTILYGGNEALTSMLELYISTYFFKDINMSKNFKNYYLSRYKLKKYDHILTPICPYGIDIEQFEIIFKDRLNKIIKYMENYFKLQNKE